MRRGASWVNTIATTVRVFGLPIGTRQAPDEVEGDWRDDYEARHNPQLSKQVYNSSVPVACSIRAVTNRIRCTKLNQQKRFGNSDPALLPDDPDRVEQFDQDEGQQHISEDAIFVQHLLENR